MTPSEETLRSYRGIQTLTKLNHQNKENKKSKLERN